MRNTGTIPDCMHFGSESALNGQEISNLFAKHFSEVYVDTDCPDPQLPIKNLGQISIRNVSLSEVLTKVGVCQINFLVVRMAYRIFSLSSVFMHYHILFKEFLTNRWN